MQQSRILPAALAATLVLAACGESGTTGVPTGPNAPSAAAVQAAQTREFGTAASENLGETVGAIFGGTSSARFTLAAPVGTSLSTVGAAAFAGCPTVSFTLQQGTTRTASLSLTFGAKPEARSWPPAAGDPCIFTRGSGRTYLFGTYGATSTASSPIDFDRQETLTDLGRIVSNDSAFTRFRRFQQNGTRRFTSSATTLVVAESLTSLRVRKDSTDSLPSSTASTLNATFTADPGQTITRTDGARLPNGTITVTGSWQFAGKVKVTEEGKDPAVVDVNATKSVETVTPLVYDASCTSGSGVLAHITAGQLKFTKLRGTDSVTFTVTWSACGADPVVAQVTGAAT